MIKEELFSVNIADNMYLISKCERKDLTLEERMKPQAATANSYLVIGEEKALLFDLAVNDEQVWEYVCSLTEKPVQLVLSHGHVDHIYHLNRREKVWVHQGDMDMIRTGMPGISGPTVPCPIMYALSDGDKIDLGSRQLSVIHIPGHTPGSILLLDYKSGVLLSGDTVARRLLFGISGFVSWKGFCHKLTQLSKRDFSVIYSAHDRCPLPKSHIDRITHSIGCMQTDGRKETAIPLGTFLNYTYGKEDELDYCDIAMLLST